MFLSYERAGSQVDYLQKNIWTSFCVLLFAGLILLYIISTLTWQSIYRDTLNNQQDTIFLVSTSTLTTLRTQENQLDLIGLQLLENDNYTDLSRTRSIMHKLLNNPVIAGFGLISNDGNFLVSSNTFHPSLLPNLKHHPATNESFLQTLESEKMVVGKTYLSPTLGRWILPIRKALRDESGKVVAVVSAGLEVTGNYSFIEGQGYDTDGDNLMLLREKDLYPQYVSTGYLNYSPDVYRQPLLKENYDYTFRVLKAQGIDRQEIMSGNKIYNLEVTNRFGRDEVVSFRYLNEFELWVLAFKPKSDITNKFLSIFWTYLIAFLLVMSTLYWLFSRLVKTERQRVEELEFKSYHDDLTGLPNLAKLKLVSAGAHEQDKSSYLIFYVDLDNFKSANESFGRDFGDEVLIDIARRLSIFCPDMDCVYHTSGDEYVIRKPVSTDDDIYALARQLLSILSEPYARNDASIMLTASIGVACSPEHGKTLSETIKAAEIAMFEAKKHKNHCSVFDNSIYAAHHEKQSIEQELKLAVGSKQFCIHYQPQFNSDGVVTGLEALVRWHNPKLGFIPPDKFIRIAESAGLMPSLGKHIMSLIFRDAKQIDTLLDSPIHLAINISATQFMQDDFVTQFVDMHQQCPSKNILYALELTESVFVEDMGFLLPKIEELRAQGITLSLDDFGTGFSSLSLLRQLPIDELKIDKSFVDSLIDDMTARKMIKNIISIGDTLELSVIAEGVETKQHVDILQSLNCHRFQGYYFSKPLPLDGLMSWIKEKDLHQKLS